MVPEGGSTPLFYNCEGYINSYSSYKPWNNPQQKLAFGSLFVTRAFTFSYFENGFRQNNVEVFWNIGNTTDDRDKMLNELEKFDHLSSDKKEFLIQDLKSVSESMTAKNATNSAIFYLQFYPNAEKRGWRKFAPILVINFSAIQSQLEKILPPSPWGYDPDGKWLIITPEK